MQEKAPSLSMMQRFVKRSRNGILCHTILGLSAQKGFVWETTAPLPPLLSMVLLAREEESKRRESSILRRGCICSSVCGWKIFIT